MYYTTVVNYQVTRQLGNADSRTLRRWEYAGIFADANYHGSRLWRHMVVSAIRLVNASLRNQYYGHPTILVSPIRQQGQIIGVPQEN